MASTGVLLKRRRTKIVATLGPATRSPDRVRALVEAGVDVFRLNFSHGTHDEHTEALAQVRAAGQETGRRLAVLQDLGGPKIRLGPIPGDSVECRVGDEFRLVVAGTSDDPRVLTCSYRELARDDPFLTIGQSLLALLAAGVGGAMAAVIHDPQGETAVEARS